MENAREAGADAAMVLPSFYYHMGQSEIIKHYQYINDHSGLDIMLYNNPASSSPMELDTMDELCKLERTRIIKDASMRIDTMTDYIFRIPEKVGMMCGCDYLLYPAYASGAIGWVSMTANVLPRMSVEFHKAMLEEHDYDKGLDLYKKMWPMLTVVERFPKPTQAVKYILKEVVGIDVGTVRRPRYELSEEEKKYVLAATNIRELVK